MPGFQEQMTQELSCADYIPPANAGAGTQNSNGIDMQKFHRCMFEVQIGAITGAGTTTSQLQSCKNANFASNVHNIGSNAVANTGNTRITLETSDEAVEQNNPGDRYVRLQCVTAVNNVIYGVTGWGGASNQEPAQSQDNTTIVVSRTIVT
jgi:hypothetical protein